MKYNSIYNKFSSGELSPYLKGRTDLEEYYSGVEEMTNFLPIKQGGASLRPGTFQTTASTLYGGRIFSFHPSDDASFLIMAAPGYGLKIYKIDSGNTNISTVTAAWYIWNKSADFSNSATIYNPVTENGALTTKIFQNLNFTSYGDLFVICDGTGTIAPIIGKRTGDNAFLIDSILYPTVINPSTNVLWLDTNVKYPLRFPYQDTNIDNNIQLKPSATTGNITITSQNSSGTPINFFTGDVSGMMIKISHGAVTGVARVTSKVSDSVVNAQISGVAFSATTASANFEISAFNAKDGYPKSACFFQGRLYFGGNNSFPDTIWGSLVGNIYHFMSKRLLQDGSTNTSTLNYFGAIKETDPFNFTIAATSTNTIQWMFPSQTLIIGTTSTEYSITGGTDSILSISNIEVSPISNHGSAKVQPVKVGSSIIFVSFDRKRLYEIPKDLRQYQSATELSVLSEGILDKTFDLTETNLNFYSNFGMQELAYQENEGTIWIRCYDSVYGKTGLVSLSIDKTSKTLAWAKHTFPTGDTFATISSICISNDPAKGNKPFLSMLMYRNGDRYWVERMWFRNRYQSMNQNNSFSTVQSDKTVLYLDCAIIATTTADTFYIGSDFNSTVSVVSAQGDYLGDFTPNYGQITVPNAALKSPLTVGYKYTGIIKTMPIEAGAQFGVAQGSLRRGHEISIYIDRSRGGKYKASKSTNEFPIDQIGTGSALKTGEIKLSLNSSPDDHQIIIKQDQPYPLTILWLLTKGYTNDA